MVYLVAKERNGKGETRITRYYKCPVCGTKVVSEKLLLKPYDGKIQVFTLLNGKKQIIYASRRVPVKTGRPRRSQPRRPSRK